MRKTPSAPRILLSSIWYSSKMKSWRSSGTFTAERTSERCLSSP